MKFKDYLLILVLIGLDQITKYVVDLKMTLNQSIDIIDGFFSITYVRNTGAAFSILRGNKWLFVAIAVVISIGLCIYMYKEKVDKLEKAGLLMIIAGAIGNCIDRLRLGYVIDFLDFNIFGWDYPVFNVADIFVVVGVASLLISILLFSKKEA